MPNQELQAAVSAFNARIAEYVAKMDADEAEAYRRAEAKDKRAIDAILEGRDVPASSL